MKKYLRLNGFILFSTYSELDRNPKSDTKYYIWPGLGFWVYKSKKLKNFQKYVCRTV